MVPERELLRDQGVLVEHRLDLHRPHDQPFLRHLVGDQLAVAREVAARRHPGDHVVAFARGQRHHQQELQPVLAGQRHQHVVGPHLDLLAAVFLARRGPHVLAIVEHLRQGHVVGAVDRELGREQLERIAQVPAQALGHRRQVAEQFGHGRPVGPDDRVVGLDDIEGDIAVVGVDHDLQGIADVVVGVEIGLRVGIGLGNRIGVLDPIEPAPIDREVGIVVELEEGC